MQLRLSKQCKNNSRLYYSYVLFFSFSFLLTSNLKHEGQHDLQHMVDGCHFIQFFCCCSYCAYSPFHTIAEIFERQQSPVDTKTTTCSQGVIQVKYYRFTGTQIQKFLVEKLLKYKKLFLSKPFTCELSVRIVKTTFGSLFERRTSVHIIKMTSRSLFCTLYLWITPWIVINMGTLRQEVKNVCTFQWVYFFSISIVNILINKIHAALSHRYFKYKNPWNENQTFCIGIYSKFSVLYVQCYIYLSKYIGNSRVPSQMQISKAESPTHFKIKDNATHTKSQSERTCLVVSFNLLFFPV